MKGVTLPADCLASRDSPQAAAAFGFDVLRMLALGATPVTCYTSGQGVGAVPQQIAALR